MYQYHTHTDNYEIGNKIRLRKRAIAHLDSVRVLDCFAGENKIWSRIKTDAYLGIEKEKGKGRNLCGDNRKIIPALDLSRFNVIDLDTYGVPAEQLIALYKNKTFQRGTVIIYTCIFGATCGISNALLDLFGMREIRDLGYMLTFGLHGELFNGLLAKLGVSRVWEYEVNDKGFSKRYGYFNYE